MKMDGEMEMPLSKNKIEQGKTGHANKLPTEIVGRFMQNLSVGDRFKNERVSPRWKWAFSKMGWIQQRKLDADIIFEGTNEEEEGVRFWENLDDGTCHLASLLHQCDPWLRELDLHLFGGENIERVLPQIAETISSLSELKKLDIQGLDLHDFVEKLPSTLRDLKTSGPISDETLEALSVRCPDLVEVPFQNLQQRRLGILLEHIGKFPRQQRLDLSNFWFAENVAVGALASIGQLKELQELELWHCRALDGPSLEAIVGGCQRLQLFDFNTSHLTEETLFHLAKMPSLTELRVNEQNGEFTDAVLKAIAQRGQLKSFVIAGQFYPKSEAISDSSIEYLVDRCKSLVKLTLSGNFPRFTERSLEAVVTELHRRHGWPPRELPTDDQDPGIFYFEAWGTGIDEKKTKNDQKRIGNNPWLKFNC